MQTMTIIIVNYASLVHLHACTRICQNSFNMSLKTLVIYQNTDFRLDD